MKSAPVSPTGPGAARILVLAIALIAMLAPAAMAEEGYLGVKIQDVDETLAAALDLDDAEGVLINEVIEDSPAEAAGLQRGDLILTIDGRDAVDARRFTRRIRRLEAGQTTDIEFVRKGKPMSASVTLAEVPERDPRFSGPKRIRVHDDDAMWFDAGDEDISIVAPGAEFMKFGQGAHLGVSIHDLDEDLGRYFGAEEGVLVLSVSEDSAAEEAGLKAGDVIISIDEDEVETTIDLHEVLEDLDPGDEVALVYLRDRQEFSVQVELGEEAGLHFIREHAGNAPLREFHLRRAPRAPDLHRQYRMQIHEPGDLHEELQRLREHLEQLEEQLEEMEEG